MRSTRHKHGTKKNLRVSHRNWNCQVSHESFVAQWLEHLTGVRKVIGSIQRKSVTSRYHGSKILYHNKRKLRQQRRRRQRERQKKKKNFAGASRFLSIFYQSLHDCDMKLPNFTNQLYGVNEHKKGSFSFSKLRYGPFGFNPENFANIWQIKWNRIRSMKFETVRIHFQSEFSVRCHPKILLPW